MINKVKISFRSQGNFSCNEFANDNISMVVVISTRLVEYDYGSNWKKPLINLQTKVIHKYKNKLSNN